MQTVLHQVVLIEMFGKLFILDCSNGSNLHVFSSPKKHEDPNATVDVSSIADTSRPKASASYGRGP